MILQSKKIVSENQGFMSAINGFHNERKSSDGFYPSLDDQI